ncbi:MAG TPA: alpha/beta hydrolase [Bryobacteraceae bacterium]
MILAIFLSVLLVFFAAAWLYQRAGIARDRRRFPPPGRMLALGERRLHFCEQGSGSPVVVFEAGLAASSLSWSYVAPLVASFTRAVSYDRAGLGWSDDCALHTLDGLTEDLRSLLVAACIPPPYVLVGHSFGSLIVRAFAHRYPAETAGLVFVDPVSIAGWANCSERDQKRILLGAMLSRRGARLARIGIVRLALAAAGLPNKRITQAIARASAGKATPTLGRLAGEVQKLPAAAISVARAHWSTPKPFRAMANYLECLPACAEAARGMPLSENVPFIVISAANATPEELAEREDWVAHSRLGRHFQVPGTGHWLHLERPDVVAEAVKELVETFRSMRHGVDGVVDPDTKS